MCIIPEVAGIPFPKKLRLDHEVYANPANAFHVVIRAMPETSPFRGPIGQATWHLLEEERNRASIELLAACLMPDHLHVVVQPKARSIIQWVAGFKSYSTRLSWSHRTSKALWQPSFYDRLLRDENEFLATLEYIRSNPVEDGLVTEASEWPWLWIPTE